MTRCDIRPFWAHADAPDMEWHVFITASDEGEYPDESASYIALCGAAWSGVAAVRLPPLLEAHCRTCMRELHDMTLTGKYMP